MPTYNLTGNLATGKQFAIAKQGGQIPLEELNQLRAEADAGDPASIVALRAFDYGVDDAGRELPPEHAVRAMEAIMHDCPECQAARARGETPRVYTWPDILAMGPIPIPGFRTPPKHSRRRTKSRKRRR